MAVVTPLPNGYLVITVSPRESVALMDQLLEPSEYPWQSSESQMISMEIKSKLKEVLEAIQKGQTEFLNAAVRDIQEREREDQRVREEQARQAQLMQEQLRQGREAEERQREEG